MSKIQPSNSAMVGIQKISLILLGLPGSPLVVHNFSEKAKKGELYT